MRVALLSMLDPAGDAGDTPRAFLRVGGYSLARHQLGLALALGCERIVCIAAGHDPEIVALQHAAEDAGAMFHRVPGLHGVLALVSAHDEVIALGDGVLAWPELAITLLDAGGVVLVQPVEIGLIAGFERLDLNSTSASAMRVPGRLLDRMGDMPADIDVFATLQRVALQAGIPQRPLPEEALDGGRWTLVRTEAEAHAIEPTWIRLHTTAGGKASPAMWVAGWGVRRLGPALLHAGSSGTVVAIAASVLAALGLVLGWFGFVAVGLAFCAMAWIWFESAALLGRFERRSLRLARPNVAPVVVYAWAMDGVLLVLLALGQGQGQGAQGGQGLANAFAPLMLLGLARLVPPMLASRWAPWLKDRAVLALALMAAGFVGMLSLAIGGVAIGYLITGIVAVGRQNRLTQV